MGVVSASREDTPPAYKSFFSQDFDSLFYLLSSFFFIIQIWLGGVTNLEHI